jgi:hypothetical protein
MVYVHNQKQEEKALIVLNNLQFENIWMTEGIVRRIPDHTISCVKR